VSAPTRRLSATGRVLDNDELTFYFLVDRQAGRRN
jgi:hypothetical protein